MSRLSKIAIIYLSYNPRSYLDRVIESLKNTTYPKDKLEFVVIDNPHEKLGGAGTYLKEKLTCLSGRELPLVTILENEENLGYAKGMNVGIEYAIEQGFDYVFLHNQDGFMGIDCLERCLNIFKQEPNTGIVQPLISLYPKYNLINSAGNKFHYLGFGYVGGYKLPINSLKFNINSSEIDYCSGAGSLVRVSLLKKYGLLDEDFYMYHEDLELGLRFRSLGFKNMLAQSARFYHEYEFFKNKNKYYFMERNRGMVFLMYYKWRTILLFTPIFLLVELGVWGVSFSQGWWKEKLRSYFWWLKLNNLKLVLKKRREIQKNKIITDKEFLKLSVAEINFENVDNFILKYIGNPIMRAYFWVAKTFIFW